MTFSIDLPIRFAAVSSSTCSTISRQGLIVVSAGKVLFVINLCSFEGKWRIYLVIKKGIIGGT